MNRLVVCLIITLNSLSLWSQEKNPQLLVTVVVDQMRYDYLDRFKGDFGAEGFNRLVNEGLSFEEVYYSYKPTYTGPGHATLFTGQTPKVHGIVANNWYDRLTKQSIYCVGTKDTLGNFVPSPSFLKVNGLADILKKSSEGKSKVFAISLKDRSAIIPGGKSPNGVFWFDSKAGSWTSSAYYSQTVSDYIHRFNRRENIDQYLSNNWENHFAPDKTWPDESKYEGFLSEGSGNTFPYNLKEIKKEVGYSVLNNTPAGNRMTLDLALEILKEEQLGMTSITDLISISFSVTDYIGHRYGIHSLELRNVYFELDKCLADLLSYLDEEIGKGNYVLALSSDHGAAENPQRCIDFGSKGGFINSEKLIESMESSLDSLFGERVWIEKFMNLNIYWSEGAKEILDKNEEEFLTFIDGWVKKQEGIDGFWIPGLKLENSYNSYIQNAYDSERSGDLILLEAYQWMNYSKTGTTHGSPYAYDTHVPYIIFGASLNGIDTKQQYSVASMLSILLNSIDFAN